MKPAGALLFFRFRGAKSVVAAASITVFFACLSVAMVSRTRAAAQTTTSACTPGTLVTIDSGPVCGLTANGVTSYLGVPFAAPPVGARRWQAPAPASPWTATLQATAAGPNCPQPPYPPGAPPSAAMNEDCLTLNIHVPMNAGPALPVMVEIHGGGFVIGTPPNGAHVAEAGRVIMVAIHYRLGILGFLVDRFLGERSGDYGLQDQQAALRWVQRNIARFGGDPNNVTLFGQSAGGSSVCAAAVSPTAQGLFQKGISESGIYNYNVDRIWAARTDCKSELLSEAQAQQLGDAFATKVGCGSAKDVAACLRALPAQTLVDNGGQVGTPNAGGAIGPTINAAILPLSPAKAFRSGQMLNKIALMFGVTRDEFNGGLYTLFTAKTPDEYRELLQQQFGAQTSKVMELYPLSRFPNSSPFIAQRTVMADAFSVCPALTTHLQLSKHFSVFAFENDNATAPQTAAARQLGLPLGSFHNGENPFLFPPAGLALDPNQAAFGDQVVSQWAGFARTGDPTVDGAPSWPLYNKGRLVMSLVPAGNSTLIPSATLNMQHNCDFWNNVNRVAPWAVP